MNNVSGQNAELFNFKAGGIYSHHYASEFDSFLAVL